MKTNMQYYNYFEEHYKYTFSEVDIINYGKWFQSQLNTVIQHERMDIDKSLLEIGSGVIGFYSIIGKSEYFLTLYKAIWWNVLHINQNIKKRLIIQANRKLSDREINKITKWKFSRVLV